MKCTQSAKPLLVRFVATLVAIASVGACDAKPSTSASRDEVALDRSRWETPTQSHDEPERIVSRAPADPEARAAYRDLLTASIFESAYVGYSGRLSDHARSVRVLVAQPRALELFERLWKDGTIVARLYALTAFWYLAPERFSVLVAEFGDVKQGIRTQVGCIVSDHAASEVLHGCDGDPTARRLTPGTGAYDAFCDLKGFCGDLAGGFEPISIVEGTSLRADLCERPKGERPRVEVAPNGSLCRRNHPADDPHWLAPCP